MTYYARMLAAMTPQELKEWKARRAQIQSKYWASEKGRAAIARRKTSKKQP